MKSPRQQYNPSFGSKQRPPSPGFLATNDVKCTRVAYGSLLLDRGIELPQESDMAVRVIDVATPGRDWDRVRDNRYSLWTVETA